MAHRSPFIPLVKNFFETDPQAAARSLETMAEEEALTVIRCLPSTLAGEVFQNLHVQQAAELLKALPVEQCAEIVDRLPAQRAASIFLAFSDEERKNILPRLSDKTGREIQELLSYPEGSAGRIMGTEFLAFHQEIKVKDAIHKIRNLAQKRVPASYVYVVDGENHLVGVINMRDLMLASGDTDLASVMRKDIFSVNAFTDREEIANQLADLHYFAAPVVDAEYRLLGVVRSEGLIDHVQTEATEDIQKMFGAGGSERAFSPIGFSIRKRLPWLHINLLTAFLAASVVSLFESTIAKITILAVFMPVVAGMGGNAGNQALAIVMRSLVMREIQNSRAFSLILKQSLIGLLNGIVLGIVTAVVAWLWNGNPYLGLVIGLAMVVNMIAAGLAGAAIPLGMKALGFDPAQSSSIFLTTVTDVMGFLSFLGLAVLFQNHLV